jgi:hypothetical protein
VFGRFCSPIVPENLNTLTPCSRVVFMPHLSCSLVPMVSCLPETNKLMNRLHLYQLFALVVDSDVTIGANLHGQSVLRRADGGICATPLSTAKSTRFLRLKDGPYARIRPELSRAIAPSSEANSATNTRGSDCMLSSRITSSNCRSVALRLESSIASPTRTTGATSVPRPLPQFQKIQDAIGRFSHSV